MTDGVVQIDGLNERIRGFGGKELDPLLGPDGQPLPDEQQLTLGNVLLSLVATMDTEANAKKVMLTRRVCDNIFSAMEAGSPYLAGMAAQSIIRAAAEQNKPGYRMLVLSEVYAALGVENDDTGA